MQHSLPHLMHLTVYTEASPACLVSPCSTHIPPFLYSGNLNRLWHCYKLITLSFSTSMAAIAKILCKNVPLYCTHPVYQATLFLCQKFEKRVKSWILLLFSLMAAIFNCYSPCGCHSNVKVMSAWWAVSWSRPHIAEMMPGSKFEMHRCHHLYVALPKIGNLWCI